MEDNFSLRKLKKAIDNKVISAAKKPVNLVSRKKRATVMIPRKMGRVNPDFIKTDQFDFAKIITTVQTVGKAAESVGNAASQVSTAVNTVKATVKTPPANTAPLANAGYQILTNQNPYVNNGYNTTTPVTGGQQPLILQPESSMDMNTMLMIGGGLFVMVILTFVLNRK